MLTPYFLCFLVVYVFLIFLISIIVPVTRKTDCNICLHAIKFHGFQPVFGAHIGCYQAELESPATILTPL